MKKLWKTKEHYYIRRFAFIGGSDRYTVDEALQISISAQLYFSGQSEDILVKHNIKRCLVDEWKGLAGWEYHDENC